MMLMVSLRQFENSDSDLGGGGWDLKLLNQVGHEPVTVCYRVEVVMIVALNIDAHSFGLNLWDVLQGDVMRAGGVLSGREHRDRNNLDVVQVDHLSLVLACEPIVVKLLESLHVAIHGPILL